MHWETGTRGVWGRTAALFASVLVVCGCASNPQAGVAGGVQRAWVQADDQGHWQARVITTGPCPEVQWRGGARPMLARAAPVTLPARPGGAQADSQAAVFTDRSCAADLPADAQSVHVGPLPLPSPPSEIRHVVLLGDTGCRMKQSENAFQDCNDPARWPFASVAARAALHAADLVVHLGDMHYRESPCPAGRAGCAGSPWGYGHDTWEADFFQPAAPLLAAAPWVMVRGNHESCARAGAGWFRYLDPRGPDARLTCADPADDAQADHTPPYAIALDAQTQLIVFDSSAVSGRPYQPGDAAFQRYLRDLAVVAKLVGGKAHSIFLNHHPVLAFGGSATGAPRPGMAGLLSVLRTTYPETLYPPGVDLVINGHVHLFEALSFASPHPAAWLTGHGGSAMEGQVDVRAALSAQPAPGARVQAFVTQGGFGYSTLERHAGGWELKAWSLAGSLRAHCRLEGRQLQCDPGLATD